MALPVNTLLLFFVSLLLGLASSERCQHVKELPVPAAECGRRIDAPRAVGAILRLKNCVGVERLCAPHLRAAWWSGTAELDVE